MGGHVVRRQYDWSATSPSRAIPELLAVLTDRQPTALDPLYDAVDPDALDTIVGDGSRSDAVSVSFTHAGFSVTVRADGEVVVHALSGDADR